MKRLVLILILFLTSLYAQTPIAVLDFLSNGLSGQEAQALTDRFRNELFQYKNFDIMERAYMEEILDEQGFQLSGCTSDECVIEAGKLVGVEQMVGGSISRVGETFTIAARIISVETGKILNTASYDYTGEIDMLLKEGMKQVAAVLAHEKPAPQKFGYLSISSSVPDTKFFLNDHYINRPSLSGEKFKADKYTLSLRRPYFFPLDTTIYLEEDEYKTLNFQLVPNIKHIKERITTKKNIGKKLYILSGFSYGLAAYLHLSANQIYDDYQTARLTAEEKHREIKFRDHATWVSTGVGTVVLARAIQYSIEISQLKRLLIVTTDCHVNEFRLALEVKL
ncbi:MAG: hypothetical protein JXQ65_00010 [Candidatus Marinimicrobia bacterium]|nr:hypothetical protein [Candidatus Neomarinimicrobiota bacterium]